MALDTPQESVEKLDEQFLESISELCKVYYERTYDEKFPRRNLPQNQELTLLLEEIRQTNNINAVNKGGNTLLHLAARASEKEMVDILLSHPQIDVNIQNNQKMTPFMMVLTRGKDMDEIAESLLNHPKINLKIRNNIGATARMMATKYQMNRFGDYTRVIELMEAKNAQSLIGKIKTTIIDRIRSLTNFIGKEK